MNFEGLKYLIVGGRFFESVLSEIIANVFSKNVFEYLLENNMTQEEYSWFINSATRRTYRHIIKKWSPVLEKESVGLWM